IEQHRPVGASEARPGSRRWFQSCMVNPTTVFPWRTSSAATVELSTPPDIATAMGALLESSSGMDGNAAQVRHRGFERLCQPIHLGGGVGAAQRKTHAGAGAIRVEPDGGEH